MKASAKGLFASNRAILLVGAAAAAMMLPGVALAQTKEEEAKPAPAAAGSSLQDGNEIVVTATKREQTLQDVPVAVSVTTADTIEKAQIRDLKDLASVVPSLRVTQLQTSSNVNFIIRGFGNGANNPGIEPAVAVFIDGVYRSRSAAQIADFPDVKRVEVLRGPQSTLFGKNASAGVISIVTQEPKFTLGGVGEISYGNYNALVVKGMVTGPLSETVAFSLAGSYNRRDGYISNPATGVKENNRDRWSIRGQLLFQPSSDLKVRLIADYGRINEVCCAVVNVTPSLETSVIKSLPGGNVNDATKPFGDVVYSNFPSQNVVDNYGFSGQIDWKTGPLTITSITAYRKSKNHSNFDADFTSADLLQKNSADVPIDTFTQELRFATDLDGPLNLVAGMFYSHEIVNIHNDIQFGTQIRPYANALIQAGTNGALSVPLLEQTFGALDGNPSLYTNKFFAAGQGLIEDYRMTDKSFSIYGQADFKITDRLTLTGGINYTHDSKTFSVKAGPGSTFAMIDFNAPQYAPFRYQLLFGGALGKGLTSSQANAFATANMNVPAANPLNALIPLQFLPPFLALPNSVEPGKLSDNNVSYTARLAYAVSDQINAYVSYATGFKPSSVNLSRDSRPFPSDAAALIAANLAQVNQTYTTRYALPEKSSVYEFGLKANFGILTANLAVFKEDIKNFQSNVFTGLGFVLTNAGKESVRGFEIESTLHPIKQLTLSGALTYLDPKYDEFKVSSLGDLSGTKPASIPTVSMTLGAQWDQELGNSDHMILRGDYHYESKVQIVEGLPNYLGTPPNTAAAIAAGLPYTAEENQVDASLTYAMQNGLEFTLWGRNITNNRFLINVFPSVAQGKSVSGYPNQPRTWGGSIHYKW